MQRLPQRPHLDHLKKQAKDLLARAGLGDAEAVARFRQGLPAARNATTQEIAGMRLADAHSCLAREYGFSSWAELKSFVEARNALASDRPAAILGLLNLVYAGDITGRSGRARPQAAARLVEERPDLLSGDPWLACAVGDQAALRDATARDPRWVNRAGGPLALPPLVAVTHASLVRLPAYRERLLASARLLLDAGADPNQSVANRWMATLDAPDVSNPLSALYGAAGQNHDPELTALLLLRDADPNDNESLYHSLDRPECTRLLLEAGARVSGTNALYRALDLEDATPLKLLLANGGDPNEPASGPPSSDWGSPLLWAIRRRRSPEHVAALLAAGADPSARTPDGVAAEAMAQRFGLPEVASLLRAAAGEQVAPSDGDDFVAACARGDERHARAALARRPGLLRSLSEAQLRMLPELAAQGAGEAVRVMVGLGWPIATRGGDWDASALNHAVFRGDAALTRVLLDHGAHWSERHGFGDDVCGTLSWASLNEPVDGGDWPGCAAALRAFGLPRAKPDPSGSDAVVVGAGCRLFSDDVRDVLLAPDPSVAARVAPDGGGG